MAVIAGCAATRPAPVSDRTHAPAPTPATKPAPRIAQTAPPETAARVPLYTVRQGDTVFSIAKAHGVDPRDVAAWNNLEGNRIVIGQQLRVTPPEGVVATPVKPGPGAVEGRPIDGAPPAAVTVDPNMKTQPQGVRVPHSDEAYARLAKQPLPPAAKPDAVPAETAKPAADSDWLWPATGKIVGNFGDGAHKGISIAGKMGQPVLASAGGRVIFSGQGIRGLGRLIVIKHNNDYLSVYAHNSNLLVKEGQNVNRGQKIAEMGNSDADQVKLHFEIRRQGKPVDPSKLLPQL